MGNNMANSKVSRDQLRRMQREFLQHDQRGDAKIGHQQLGQCLRVLGANPSEATVRQHIQGMRENHIERISFDEFVSIYESILPLPAEAVNQTEQLINGLSLLDESNSGYMPVAQLRHILSSCGERLTKEELDELLLNRVNDRGLINYVELINVITQEPPACSTQTH